ncbi:PucR family transcriptional regulator [Subtercola lobariae]|uniref:PucR family transcriptional regulator n=1 Tax=Subtercola lobariae TaxID=1588641 RepID=A0A917B3I8_9MICO|nr:helix-turn-helix domain-containing protein [Subtercola lobariae]GGF19189.1 PucR family transcriptional regulator [Subtercola lobariae]
MNSAVRLNGVSTSPALAQLSDVLRLLPDVVCLNPTPVTTAHPISSAELYDKASGASSWRDSIIMAVGLAPSEPEFSELVHHAEAKEAGAVAVKAYGSNLAVVHEIATSSGVAVLLVRDDADWVHLATLIRSFALGTATDSVSGVRLGDLYSLANSIASITNGATSIVDPLGRILGYSTLSGQPIDDLRRATTLALQETTAPAFDSDFRSVYSTEHAVLIPGAVGEMARVAIAVRAGDELLGTIWTIDPGRERHDETIDELERLAPLAGLHMLHARSGSDFADRRNADLMNTVLTGAPHADFAATQLGMKASNGFAVIAFQLARIDRESLDTARELRRLLNLVTLSCHLQFDVSLCTLIGSYVVALIPSTGADPRLAHSRIAADICASARNITDYPVFAAVGRIAMSIEGLVQSKTDALSTLQLVAAGSESGGPAIGLFEDFRARLGLRSVGEFLASREGEDNNDLDRLRHHDLANHTEYVATLHAYLQSNGNIASIAKSLHIHGNTARYRIDRLVNEFGFNLNDRDERLWTWLRLSTA